MKAVKPWVSSCNRRSRARCSIRSARVSTCPNIIVAEPRPPKRVPCAADLDPAVGRGFARADGRSHPIDEDFRPAAGQRSQAGLPESFEHGPHRQARERRQMVDLRRAESVDVDLRKTLP